MIDFITILSPRSTRPMDASDEVDGENKRKKPERINSVPNSFADDAESNDHVESLLSNHSSSF